MKNRIKTGVLKHDVEIQYPPPRPYKVTLPKGAAVHYVDSPGGGWAISSVQLLVELTGNTHDPHYRYAWVSPEDVNEISLRR